MVGPSTGQTSPRVSVVIPVYNGMAYLRETLESVFAQTCPDFELIVVDDGSTDDTPRIIASYGSRIRSFRQPNGGGASAINLGIRQARGEWIAWLSADDLWSPTKLEEQVGAIDARPFIGLLYSDFVTIGATGNVLSRVHLPPPPSRRGCVVELMRRCFINGCASLIHREVFARIGLFDEKDRITYDYDMWLRLAPHFDIRYLPEVLASYRVHPGQLSRREEAMDHARRRVRARALRSVETGLALRGFVLHMMDEAAVLPWKLRPGGGGQSPRRVASGLVDGLRVLVNPSA